MTYTRSDWYLLIGATLFGIMALTTEATVAWGMAAIFLAWFLVSRFVRGQRRDDDNRMGGT